MATQSQINKFILTIAPYAQFAYRVLGKVKPSVCIAMACVESAYGTAGSCKYNSYLGHKVGSGKTAKKYWNGTFVNLKTKEEYKIGQHTVIFDAFRTYKSMEQCVLNFYELLNSSVYKKVEDTDYKTQMKQIKACKYMTSSKEVNTVISIIEKYGLTKYDTKTESVDLTESNKYYPAYDGFSISIVVALRSIGEDFSYKNRKAIAAANGIVGYRGYAAQNETLLKLLRNGRLIRP